MCCIIPSFLGNKIPLIGKDLPNHNMPKIRRGMPVLRDNSAGTIKKGEQTNRFSQHYPLFLLLARTGLRIGEAVALKWEDIDFNGRFINVERTYYKGRIGSTKNGKPRKVDMSWQLKDALLELKKGRVVVDIDEDSQWMFTETKGGL